MGKKLVLIMSLSYRQDLLVPYLNNFMTKFTASFSSFLRRRCLYRTAASFCSQIRNSITASLDPGFVLGSISLNYSSGSNSPVVFQSLVICTYIVWSCTMELYKEGFGHRFWGARWPVDVVHVHEEGERPADGMTGEDDECQSAEAGSSTRCCKKKNTTNHSLYVAARMIDGNKMCRTRCPLRNLTRVVSEIRFMFTATNNRKFGCFQETYLEEMFSQNLEILPSAIFV